MKTIHEKLAATGRAWDLIVAAVENTGTVVGDVDVSVNDYATTVSIGGRHEGTVGLDWKDANALIEALPAALAGWEKGDPKDAIGGVQYEYWTGTVAGFLFSLRVIARALTVVGGAR